MNKDFRRGAIAAAGVAEAYNSLTTHRYRLDDCILCKLNVSKRNKPRLNKLALRTSDAAWVLGFAIALAEMHRLLINGGDSAGVCRVARAGGLTLKTARAAGVSSWDLAELRKAGVR